MNKEGGGKGKKRKKAAAALDGGTEEEGDDVEPDSRDRPRKRVNAPPPECEHLVAVAADIHALASKHNPQASVFEAMRLAGFSDAASKNRTQQMRVRRKLSDNHKATVAAELYLTATASNPNVTLRDSMRLAGYDDPAKNMVDVRKQIADVQKKKKRAQDLANFDPNAIGSGDAAQPPEFPGLPSGAPMILPHLLMTEEPPNHSPPPSEGPTEEEQEEEQLQNTKAYLRKAQRAYANRCNKNLLKKQTAAAVKKAADLYCTVNARYYMKSVRECCDEVAAKDGVRPAESAVQKLTRKMKDDENEKIRNAWKEGGNAVKLEVGSADIPMDIGTVYVPVVAGFPESGAEPVDL